MSRITALPLLAVLATSTIAVAANAQTPTTGTPTTPAQNEYHAHVTITLDTSKAPDLESWAEKARKTALTWYPRICRILASPGFEPPTAAEITIQPMDGVAYTTGTHIFASAQYIRSNPQDIGMIVHELTHVVQQYPSYNAGWLVEGIADYVRFYHYEPKSPRPIVNPDTAHYTDAYRTTAAFLRWIEVKHDRHIIYQLNYALRQNKYQDDLFKQYTGEDLPTLWNEFTADIRDGKIHNIVQWPVVRKGK